jgi:F-box and leucine-rich repeat protein 1 (S-phase kinase-associated protein 2)
LFIFIGLVELFNTCQNLKKLSLEHCVLDQHVCKLIGQNKELEVLNMSMCYGLDKTGLTWIVEGCKKLDSWNLAWTELKTEEVELICTTAPKSLHRINLSGCRLTLKDERGSSFL